MTTQPFSLEAEESVLGAALLDRKVVSYIVGHLSAADFHSPGHGRIFDAIKGLYEQDAPVDSITVADYLRVVGVLDEVGGPVKLMELQSNLPAISSAPRYAAIVKREAAARRVLGLTSAAQDAIGAGKDPYEFADELSEALQGLERIAALPGRSWLNIDEYLDQPDDPDGDWLVDGFCYRDSRLLAVAPEKSGKSVMLRQCGYCPSQARHPFRADPNGGGLKKLARAIRVAIIDCENPDRELKDTGRALRRRLTQQNGAWDGSTLAMASYPFGLDLRDKRQWLEVQNFLEAFRPELVVTGPVYKMLPAKDGENDVRHADAFQQRMGELIERFKFALILEHHAPAKPVGRKNEERELRAMGGSRWGAWPDATLVLRPEKDQGGELTGDLLVETAHPNRGRFDFPTHLRRGRHPGEWPWNATYKRAERDDQPPLSALEPPDEEEPF